MKSLLALYIVGAPFLLTTVLLDPFETPQEERTEAASSTPDTVTLATSTEGTVGRTLPPQTIIVKPVPKAPTAATVPLPSPSSIAINKVPQTGTAATPSTTSEPTPVVPNIPTTTPEVPIPQPTTAPSNGILAKNWGELETLLKNAKGGETILLQSGSTYGGRIDNIHPSSAVLITSQGSEKARVTNLDLRSVDNLTFDNIYVEFVGTPTQYQKDIRISKSNAVTFKNSSFKGIATAYLSSGGIQAQDLFNISDSSSITIEGNKISNFMHGIGISKTKDILIRNNELTAMQGDGMRFAQVQNITIENNRLHDFLGSDSAINHNDYIQFWTTGTNAPSENIVIRNNQLQSGSFNNIQGIFMRDELWENQKQGGTRYQNVLIEGNTVFNDHWHGITMWSGDHVVIRNNTVQNPPNPRTRGWISAKGDSGLEIYGNTAPTIQLEGTNDILKNENNTLTRPVK